MADYTVNISGSTTLMIRDTGGNVEFWVKTGSQTWNNQQPWSFHANGSSSGTRYFRMLRGGFWQKFGEVYVGYDQDVRFTIVNSGLGFPTYDFWQHISRSTVPGAPVMQQAYPISSSTIHVVFQGTTDGGMPILEWQIGYGPNSGGPSYLVGSSGTSDVGGFSSGQSVYFWARGRNAIGWSSWSNRLMATTWRAPDPPRPVNVSAVTQNSVFTQIVDQHDGGTAILERQLGYGLDPDNPTTFAGEFSGENSLTNLDPGKRYYFWGRSRNSVGWGPWSERREIDLIAGARVLVGNDWKRAVPYVKVGGVWKVVRPWVRDAGVWKESSV